MTFIISKEVGRNVKLAGVLHKIGLVVTLDSCRLVALPGAHRWVSCMTSNFVFYIAISVKGCGGGGKKLTYASTTLCVRVFVSFVFHILNNFGKFLLKSVWKLKIFVDIVKYRWLIVYNHHQQHGGEERSFAMESKLVAQHNFFLVLIEVETCGKLCS